MATSKDTRRSTPDTNPFFLKPFRNSAVSGKRERAWRDTARHPGTGGLIKIDQSIPERACLRAERDLDMLFWFLFEFWPPVHETPAQRCERCMLLVNAFFDTEAFLITYPSRDSVVIGCDCGWSLGFLAPEDLDAQTVFVAAHPMPAQHGAALRVPARRPEGSGDSAMSWVPVGREGSGKIPIERELTAASPGRRAPRRSLRRRR